MSQEDNPDDDEGVPMVAERERERDALLPNAWGNDVVEMLREISRFVADDPDLAVYLWARLEGYSGRALRNVTSLTRWQYRRCRRLLAAILEHPPWYH